MRRPFAWLLLVGLVPGCAFYGGGDDDDCAFGGGQRLAVADSYRDPASGQCEQLGTGGGGGGTTCDPCGICNPSPDQPPPEPQPDWALCDGSCSGLDEATCMDTSGCRAAYVSSCPEGTGCSETSVTYYACWPTAPSGPIEGGGCAGLDAQSCSEHDDCAAVHSAPYPCDPVNGQTCPTEPIGNFQECRDEVPPELAGYCYLGVTCEAVTPSCPDGTLPGSDGTCWTGYCIPVADCPDQPPACSALDEAGCIARDDCTPIYQGDNCSCNAAGACTCQTWTFTECQ
jgi:hypothetical protein